MEPHEKPIAYIAGALNDMSCAYLSNVRQMILWAKKIRELEYAVFIPGIDLLCGIACDNWSYDVCFNNSQPFLAKSDIVFVCSGWENSDGTARELDTAHDLSIPIYYGEEGYEKLKRDKDLAPEMQRINHLFDDSPLDTGIPISAAGGILPYMHVDEGSCDKHVSPLAEDYVIRFANSSTYIAADGYKLSVCQGLDDANRFTKSNAVIYFVNHKNTADLIIENLNTKLN